MATSNRADRCVKLLQQGRQPPPLTLPDAETDRMALLVAVDDGITGVLQAAACGRPGVVADRLHQRWEGW